MIVAIGVEKGFVAALDNYRKLVDDGATRAGVEDRSFVRGEPLDQRGLPHSPTTPDQRDPLGRTIPPFAEGPELEAERIVAMPRIEGRPRRLSPRRDSRDL
jgi:hypothetical protein